MGLSIHLSGKPNVFQKFQNPFDFSVYTRHADEYSTIASIYLIYVIHEQYEEKRNRLEKNGIKYYCRDNGTQSSKYRTGGAWELREEIFRITCGGRLLKVASLEGRELNLYPLPTIKALQISQ